MSKSAKTLILWVLLIMCMIAIYQFLSPEHPPAAAAAPSEPPGNAWMSTVAVAGSILAALYAFRRYVAAAQLHNGALGTSHAHLEAGRFDEAEQALLPVVASRLPQFRRAAALQRAEIACRRGDRDAALARLDEAIVGPIGRLFAARQRAVVVNAHGLAALLRASAGDEAAARAHIDAVRAEPEADPSVLARAALAEAVLADRKGDRAALREIVERSRTLWIAACARYERTLVRAYEGMLDAGSAPVYRQKADAAESAGERDPAAAWVARIAPNAAPFVRIAPAEANAAARADTDREPSDEARRKVEAARPEIKPKNSSGTTLGIWVLLILVFLAVWNIGVPWLAPALVLLAVGGLAGWIAVGMRRQRAEARRLRAGIRAFGLGELERAAADLAFEPKAAWNRVQAAHFRAEIAIAKGDMKGGLAETDRALAALAEAQGGKVIAPAPPAAGSAVVWDFPRVLASQRATALAALGRADEARAEIRWANGLPGGLTELRVALVERLAVHDFEGAARLVEGREPGVALSARDEVLGDLVRFVARPAARGEGAAARLRADLRRTPHVAAWIDAVAPGLAAAFEAAAAEGADGGRIAAAP